MIMSNTDWYSMMLYRWNIQNRQESLIHLDNINSYQIGVYNHPEYDRQTFYIIHNDQPVAAMTGDITDNGFHIILTIVSPDYRRQGLASHLYNVALNMHKTLVSDSDRSYPAEKLWENFQQKQPDNVKKINNQFHMSLN